MKKRDSYNPNPTRRSCVPRSHPKMPAQPSESEPYSGPPNASHRKPRFSGWALTFSSYPRDSRELVESGMALSAEKGPEFHAGFAQALDLAVGAWKECFYTLVGILCENPSQQRSVKALQWRTVPMLELKYQEGGEYDPFLGFDAGSLDIEESAPSIDKWLLGIEKFLVQVYETQLSPSFSAFGVLHYCWQGANLRLGDFLRERNEPVPPMPMAIRPKRGRPRKDIEEKRSSTVGQCVAELVPHFDQVLREKTALPRRATRSLSSLKRAFPDLSSEMIDAIHLSRTATTAARRYVSGLEAIELSTVANYHRAYLQSLRTNAAENAHNDQFSTPIKKS